MCLHTKDKSCTEVGDSVAFRLRHILRKCEGKLYTMGRQKTPVSRDADQEAFTSFLNSLKRTELTEHVILLIYNHFSGSM